MATGSPKRRENRKLSSSRVDWSAQWASSSRISNGALCASRSSAACTASKSSERSIAPAPIGAPGCDVEVGPGWGLDRVGAGEHPALRHQPGDGGGGVDEGGGQGGRLDGEPAEGLAERQVGQGTVTEVETVTDDHPPARVNGLVAQLGQQPGLADSGVAREQHGAGWVWLAGRRAGRARPAQRAGRARPPARRAGDARSARGACPTSSRVALTTAPSASLRNHDVCSRLPVCRRTHACTAVFTRPPTACARG